MFHQSSLQLLSRNKSLFSPLTMKHRHRTSLQVSNKAWNSLLNDDKKFSACPTTTTTTVTTNSVANSASTTTTCRAGNVMKNTNSADHQQQQKQQSFVSWKAQNMYFRDGNQFVYDGNKIEKMIMKDQQLQQQFSSSSSSSTFASTQSQWIMFPTR